MVTVTALKPSLPKQLPSVAKVRMKGNTMTWTTPILIEIRIGLEINGYLPAEF